MKYYTYILISQSKKKTYTGYTTNLQRRLEEHNAGKVKSSKAYRPYRILYYEEFETVKGAKDKEKYLKSYAGRKKIKEFFFSNN